MKIIEHQLLTDFLPIKVQFYRIDPEDISETLLGILTVLMDFSWLNNFEQEFKRIAFQHRAEKTVNDIKKSLIIVLKIILLRMLVNM